MLSFIKKEGYTIVRLGLFGIGISLFSLMTIGPIMNLDRDLYTNLMSAVAIFLYVALIYFTTNDLGQKDKIKADAGRDSLHIGGYALIGALAQSLNFVLALLAIVGKLCMDNVGFFERIPTAEGTFAHLPTVAGFYATPEWASMIFSIGNLPYFLLNAMYTGLNYNYTAFTPLFMLLYPLIGIAACTAGYAVGGKRGTLFPFGTATGHGKSRK